MTGDPVGKCRSQFGGLRKLTNYPARLDSSDSFNNPQPGETANLAAWRQVATPIRARSGICDLRKLTLMGSPVGGIGFRPQPTTRIAAIEPASTQAIIVGVDQSNRCLRGGQVYCQVDQIHPRNDSHACCRATLRNGGLIQKAPSGRVKLQSFA